MILKIAILGIDKSGYVQLDSASFMFVNLRRWFARLTWSQLTRPRLKSTRPLFGVRHATVPTGEMMHACILFCIEDDLIKRILKLEKAHESKPITSHIMPVALTDAR